MCTRLILNDWGSVRPTCVAGLAEAVDTSETIVLVHNVVRCLLDFLSAADLRDDEVDEATVVWFEATTKRCAALCQYLKESSFNVLPSRITPLHCILDALGLIPSVLGESIVDCGRLSGSKRMHASSDSDAVPQVSSFDGNVRRMCFLAAAATGCQCYPQADYVAQ